MSGNIRHINNVINQHANVKAEMKREKVEKVEKENTLPLVHESCNYSNFAFATAVSGILVFAGIILYALIV